MTVGSDIGDHIYGSFTIDNLYTTSHPEFAIGMVDNHLKLVDWAEAPLHPIIRPGDLDEVNGVNEDDAIYLLKHLLMPEIFAVNQTVDYDKSGTVDEYDVIYLLQHILMPEHFPL